MNTLIFGFFCSMSWATLKPLSCSQSVGLRSTIFISGASDSTASRPLARATSVESPNVPWSRPISALPPVNLIICRASSPAAARLSVEM
ncbi:hypothetical protein D3C79_976000 [compost metagenome]